MKKIIAIIAVVIVLAGIGFLITVNSYADEKVTFKIENQSIGYVATTLHFYNSEKDMHDAAALLLETKTNVVAAKETSRVRFQLKHKPLKLYELNGVERVNIPFRMADSSYLLSPILPDTEETEYTVVADYGLRRIVYSFAVVNRTYIETYVKNVAKDAKISAWNGYRASDAVTVRVADDLDGANDVRFSFMFRNNTGMQITCKMYSLEKQIGNKWYEVKLREDADKDPFFDKYKKPFPREIAPREELPYRIQASLGVLFDLSGVNHLTSGVYRVVMPYTGNGRDDVAISMPFSIGYVPST